MNGLLKFGLAIGLAGGIFYAISRAQQSINNFSIKLKKIGFPSISKGVVTLPVDLQFDNTTGIPITINDFVADLYVQNASGQWTKGGVIQQPVQLPAGTSVKTIRPQIDLKKIFGSNILDSLDTLFSAIQSRSITIKAEAKGTANGVPFSAINIIPTQTLKL